MIYATGFSRDYERLRKLLNDGYEVICFLAFKCDGIMHRDMCLAERQKSGVYRFYARRIDYLWYDESERRHEYYPQTFEEMMSRHDVEVLDYRL